MAGGVVGGGKPGRDASRSGKGHKQATPGEIAELRKLLSGLEATNDNVMRYRWLTTDRMLHRFITARNGNVAVALKMLLEHLDWRVSYKFDTILDEDLSGAGVGHEFYWSGFDLEGRPCLVFRACEHKSAGRTAEDKVRYFCQLLERGFRDFAPAHKFCLIVDCRGAGTNVMDRKLFKVAPPIIENNFPETQHATYVVPCMPVITMAWKLISTFIDPGTADKIRICKDFDDPAFSKAFSPETLEAFVNLEPSLAPPQPYVAPDPLAYPPPPSKSTASFLSNNVRNHNKDFATTDIFHSHGTAVSTWSNRLSAATLPSAANLPSAASIPAPYTHIGGAGGEFNAVNDVSLLAYSSFEGAGAGIGSSSGMQEVGGSEEGQQQEAGQQQQHHHHHHHHQNSRHCAATAANAVTGISNHVAAANGGGGREDDDLSSVQLPPPSPGGSTVFGGIPISPSGSQLPPGRPEAGMEPNLSPAGAAAAVQRRAGLAAAAAAAGAVPPSPSGSNMGPHAAAPPSPAGDSLYSTSMIAGAEGSGDGDRREVASNGNVFDERFIAKSSPSDAGGLASSGTSGANAASGGHNNLGHSPGQPLGDTAPEDTAPEPSAADATATAMGVSAKRIAAATTPPDADHPSVGGRMLGPRSSAPAMRGGAGGASRIFGSFYSEAMQRTASRTLEFSEKNGVLYKRRDNLRGRFAYRQKYAVLRFASPEAASLVSLRRASRPGAAFPPPAPPTLTLLGGRGKNETEKVMSLEGAEVTLGTAMAGDLYPFMVSFSEPVESTPSPTRSHRSHQQQTQTQLQQQGIPPRRNTEDFMFTGVLDATGACSVVGSSDAGGVDFGDHRRQTILGAPVGAFAAAGQDGAEGNPGVGAGGRNGGMTPSGPNTTASTSTLTSPYVQWPPSNANSNASSSMMFRARKGSDSTSSSAPGATRRRKTLHLGCDTKEQTLEWARWLADAIALHEAASQMAAASDSAESGIEEAPWEGAGGGGTQKLGPVSAAGEGRGRRGTVGEVGSRGASEGGGGWAAGVANQRPRGADGGSLGQAQLQQQDEELSYRSKYAEVLEALAAASDSMPPPGTGTGPGVSALVRPGAGNDAAGLGNGDGGATRKKLPRISDIYRRSKANDSKHLDSSRHDTLPSPAAVALPPRKSSLRESFAKRRGSSRSFLGSKNDTGDRGKAVPSSSSSLSPSAVLKGLGEAGSALMTMRDSEISRLRRAYARSELSREEMRRCLRALAAQLREGEDRTGALIADREAALHDIVAKEAEFAKKEALLREGKDQAAAEAQQKEELVMSLKVENQALQAALERLRHDFQEERSLRLKSEAKKAPAAAPAAAANLRVPTSSPARLGILGRFGRASRPGSPASKAAAAEAAGGRRVPRPPATPTRNSGALSDPSLHNHHSRTITPVRVGPRRMSTGAGVGADHPLALATASVRSGSMHGGVGSRHSMPVVSAAPTAFGSESSSKEEGVEVQVGKELPWVLNTDQNWVGAVRSPVEVLKHLLEELEDIRAMSSSLSDCGVATPLVTPPGQEGRLVRGEAVGDGSGPTRGNGKKGFVAETEAFIAWSHRTGELQSVPPLESIDLPGETTFTEGCVKLLRAHAASVLRKEPEQLTTRERERMAYSLGGSTYTIARLSAHLDALEAGLPTE